MNEEQHQGIRGELGGENLKFTVTLLSSLI